MVRTPGSARSKSRWAPGCPAATPVLVTIATGVRTEAARSEVGGTCAMRAKGVTTESAVSPAAVHRRPLVLASSESNAAVRITMSIDEMSQANFAG